jgi:hypothetical protein
MKVSKKGAAVGLGLALLAFFAIAAGTPCYTHKLLIANMTERTLAVAVLRNDKEVWRGRVRPGQSAVRMDAAASFGTLYALVDPETSRQRIVEIAYFRSWLGVHSLSGPQLHALLVTDDRAQAMRVGYSRWREELNAVELVTFYLPRRLLDILSETVSCADRRLATALVTASR